MNTKLFVAAVAFAAVVATPANANSVSGPRVEAVIGWDSVSLESQDDDSASGMAYGFGAGYDLAVGGRSAIGIDVEGTNSTSGWNYREDGVRSSLDLTRDLYVGARFTTQVAQDVALYAKVGYTNLGLKSREKEGNTTTTRTAHADGVRGALGAQYQLNGGAYLGAEYRYSNYEADISRNQVVGTLGWRF